MRQLSLSFDFLRSIRVKLLSFTGVLLLSVLILVSYINISYSSKKLGEQIDSNMNSESTIVAQRVDRFLYTHLSAIEALAKSGSQPLLNPATASDYIKFVHSQNPEFLGMAYSQDFTGKNLMSTLNAQKLDVSTIPSTMAVIQEYEKGKAVIQNPIKSKASNDLVVNLGAPLMKDGKPQGFMSGSLAINEVSKTVASATIGETGYAFLFDTQGTIIFHPNSEMVLKNIKDLGSPELTEAFQKASQGQTSGLFNYSFEGIEKYGIFQKTSANWVLMLAAPKVELMRPIQEMKQTMTFVTIAVMIVGLLLTYLLAFQFSRPVKKLKLAIEVVESGDLTQQLSIRSRDEIGQAAESFNKMVTSLKAMMIEVSQTSSQLAASSEQLTAGAEQSFKVTEHIASSAQTVAEGADLQVASVVTGGQIVTDMSQYISRIVDHTREVSTVADEAKEQADRGTHSIQDVVSQMGRIHEMVDELSSVIARLSQRNGEIGTIVGIISNISQQTNLLSLNAAIEAARSGEAGRGFAVVASEIRKLADQSGQSAQQIADLIANVQQDSELVVQAIQAAVEEVKTGMVVVDETGVLFGQIESRVRGVAELVGYVDGYAGKIAENVDGVVATIESISGVAHRNAEETQQVAASAEEQLASIEEVTASATMLSQMAEELRTLVDRFKI
jgi:methyl-accepting chemotaxis protein